MPQSRNINIAERTPEPDEDRRWTIAVWLTNALGERQTQDFPTNAAGLPGLVNEMQNIDRGGRVIDHRGEK